MKALLLCLFLSSSARAAVKPQMPEDLGATTLDVSKYPSEFRATYEKIFLPLYRTQPGGTARALNSPLIEADPKLEAALRREHPELFADSRLARVGPDVWRKEVFRLKNRPPCCGACPVLSMADAKALWKFLAYDSLRRKTGERARAWIASRRGLVERFEKLNQGESKR